jgi:hypothetical protein
MAFSKLKAHLRRMKARTFDTLFESVAEACELFPQKRMSELLQGCGVCGTLNGWRSNGRNNRALDGFLGGKLEDLGSTASMALHLLLYG